MPRPTGYSIAAYGRMVTDERRMEAYAAALRQAVTPGCTVVDIGAGTGIASLLACRYGAGRVHAVEPDEAIEVARRSARDNGFADRITFHQTLSTSLELAEPADVVVSDLRGVLPLLEHHLPAILDARSRLLKPGGRLIPARDRLWAAPVEHPERYRDCEAPWRSNAFGLDLRAGLEFVVNTWWRTRCAPEQLLAPGRPWAALDYATVEHTRVSGGADWRVARPGTLHGLLLWFDAELGEGIGYSNAPGEPELVYGQAFFPLREAVPVKAGDRITARLDASLVAEDYIWRWDTEVLAEGDAWAKAAFSQSTFHGTVRTLESLARREAGHVPRLGALAQVDRAALSLLEGPTTLGEAASRLAERFPARFPRPQDALTHLAALLERYGEPGPDLRPGSPGRLPPGP